MTPLTHRPQVPLPRRLILGIATTLIVGGAFAATVALAADKHRSISRIEPGEPVLNTERCGDPPNFEVPLPGQGLETQLGPFTSDASACQNFDTCSVFDLRAYDTGDTGTISYTSEPFTLVPVPGTCLVVALKVPYTAQGISGEYVGGSGHGAFDIYASTPACDGSPQAFVTFKGKWRP